MGLLDKFSQTVDSVIANDYGGTIVDDKGENVIDGTELYMKEKAFTVNANYDIFDAKERSIYKVKGNLTGLGFKLKTADGVQVADIKKKMVAITPSYEVSLKNGQKATFKRTVVDDLFLGTLNGKDIDIKRSLGRYYFEVYVGDQKIGAVAKQKYELFSKYGDMYAISFVDDSWRDFMVAFTVTVDNAYFSNDD